MRHLLLGADKAIAWLTKAFILIAVFLLALMALLGTIDVLSLNLFGRPVPAATELASAMLPITVMLAMSYAQQQRAHITVDLFSKLFPSRLRKLNTFLALALGLAVFVLLSWGAWRLALSSIEVSERAVAAVQFPVWPVKLLFAFGATVCALQLLRELVRLLVLGEEQPADQTVVEEV
jgi:TRAP-type C4-dicarboxylate transport system permease small subunit